MPDGHTSPSALRAIPSSHPLTACPTGTPRHNCRPRYARRAHPSAPDDGMPGTGITLVNPVHRTGATQTRRRTARDGLPLSHHISIARPGLYGVARGSPGTMCPVNKRYALRAIATHPLTICPGRASRLLTPYTVRGLRRPYDVQPGTGYLCAPHPPYAYLPGTGCRLFPRTLCAGTQKKSAAGMVADSYSVYFNNQ